MPNEEYTRGRNSLTGVDLPASRYLIPCAGVPSDVGRLQDWPGYIGFQR
jgi:hypothetical protein